MAHLPPQQDQIRTISELTSGIKRLLEDAYPAVWVKGEISNIRYQSSGHIYFSLKDSSAQISAVMFRGNAQRLRSRLEDGMEVVALGNLSVYEPRGTYQLIIRECLEAGAGLLQAEFERLKLKLKDEGLFDSERKKTLPVFPGKIGIITSPTGAALRDFISILRRRNWVGEIIVFPAVVQGKEGVPDILANLNLAKDIEDLDLLVLSRGGGSLEDLWNFNEEAVVRAVANFPIPTISAVGHEIDFVLTDFAADKRAETPSAAAEVISSGYVDLVSRLQQAATSLKREGLEQLREKRLLLTHRQERLKGQTPTRNLENRHLKLDELQQRFHSLVHRDIKAQEHGLQMLFRRMTSLHPLPTIESLKERVLSRQQRFSREFAVLLQQKIAEVDTRAKRLESLSFENALRRGYAVVRNSKGSIVTTTTKLKNGQTIQVQLKDGSKKAAILDAEQLDFFTADDRTNT